VAQAAIIYSDDPAPLEALGIVVLVVEANLVDRGGVVGVDRIQDTDDRSVVVGLELSNAWFHPISL
jgi:hypothetical protein